jgi:hypothetical protein
MCLPKRDAGAAREGYMLDPSRSYLMLDAIVIAWVFIWRALASGLSIATECASDLS